MLNKLLKPFDYIAGEKALGIGLILSLITSLVANTQEAHFNGLVNLKFIPQKTPNWIYYIEPFINVIVFSFFLSIIAIILKKKFRIVDLFGTQLLARSPLLIMSLVLLFSGVNYETSMELLKSITENPNDISGIIPFIVMGILSLPFLIYMLYLMYHAFSVSVNASGTKAIILFIIGFIVSELTLQLLYTQIYPML